MKKIYSLMIVVFMTIGSYAQVYLYEDFSSGTMPPSGWSFEGLPNQWSSSASDNAGGTAPEAKFTYIQQVNTSRLVSPVIDMINSPNATLTFKYYYDYYANGPTIGVATRSGSGAWTVAWQVTPNSNQGPKTQVVELTNIGVSDFQFCLFITGNLYNVDYWFIDNIKLFSPQPLDGALAKVEFPKYAQSGTQMFLKGIVQNEGSTPITSFNVSYTVDGGAPINYSVTGVNIQLGGEYNFTHNIPIVLTELGSHEIITTLETINGVPDPVVSNNTLTNMVGIVSFIPERKLLTEEATGTWCIWCPRGTCFMHYMAEKYPDTWIGVAVHNNDPMANSIYDGAIPSIIPGFAGYPSVTTDRTAGDSDPSELEAAYLRRIQAISPATIKIVNYSWNPTTRRVSFDLESEFVADIFTELRFGAIITEDSVTGTGTGYNQANSYAGGTYGAMCGFESLPNPVPAAQMVYDHVARAILDTPFGTSGSLPENIVTGETHTYHYEYTIPASWNYSKLNFIGFITDASTKEILNATNVISSYVKANNIAFEKSVSVYPNPSNGITNVSFMVDSQVRVAAEVYDVLGNKVYSVSPRNYPAGGNNIAINCSELPQGMYLVKIIFDNQSITRKITIKK